MSIRDGDIVYDNVRVRFDYDELVELVRDLGFEDEKTIDILVKAVVYYAADPTQTIEKAFTKIGEETDVAIRLWRCAYAELSRKPRKTAN